MQKIIEIIKTVFLFVLFALVVGFTANKVARAQEIDVPEPVGYVNDFENIIDDSVEDSLESYLLNLDNERGIEVVVLTTDNFSNTYIEDYATRVYSQWQIVEEGALIIVSASQRESRIEVGNGLEGDLTDAETGRIQDEYMIPKFKQDDYTTGIKDGVYALVDGIEGDVPTNTETGSSSSSWLEVLMSFGIFALILVFNFGLFVLRWLGSTKSWWLGGLLGVLVGLFIALIFFKLWAVFIFPIILGGLGLLLDLILSKIGFGRNWKKKGRSLWNPTWTGSRSSGGFSSSGSSSFGGFSGGSRGSGGGGSSRSW